MKVSEAVPGSDVLKPVRVRYRHNVVFSLYACQDENVVKISLNPGTD